MPLLFEEEAMEMRYLLRKASLGKEVIELGNVDKAFYLAVMKVTKDYLVEDLPNELTEPKKLNTNWLERINNEL